MKGRMESKTLHGKVAAAWVATYLRDPDPTLADLADACLAALGLDDLDAAETRASEAIAKYSGMHTGFTRPAASVALEAALTATDGAR